MEAIPGHTIIVLMETLLPSCTQRSDAVCPFIKVFENNVNLIRDTRTTERNIVVLLNACGVVGLVVNTGKTKYLEVGDHRGMIANQYIRVGNNSYEKVKIFKHLGSLLTNQNSIQ